MVEGDIAYFLYGTSLNLLEQLLYSNHISDCMGTVRVMTYNQMR